MSLLLALCGEVVAELFFVVMMIIFPSILLLPKMRGNACYFQCGNQEQGIYGNVCYIDNSFS